MRTLVTAQPCFDPEDVDWLRCAVAADVYARLLRLTGEETLFLAGLEAYASKNLHEARVKGVELGEQLALKRRTLSKLVEGLRLSPDVIADTSNPKHAETLNSVFEKLVGKGLIVKGIVEQAVCEDDGGLYDEVVARCPSCGYSMQGLGCCVNCGGMLDPSSLREAVCGICDAPIRVERSEGWLYSSGKVGAKAGLTCVVSAVEGFGPPFARDQNLRFSPCFSAAVARLAFTEKWGGGLETDFQAVHFSTKRFEACHSELLPKLFEAEGFVGVAHRSIVVGHVEFRSGNVVLKAASTKLLELLGADYLRYALSRNKPDENVSIDVRTLQREINERLVDVLGQLAQRVLQFAHSKFGSIPKPGGLTQEDSELLDSVVSLRAQVEQAIKGFEYSRAYDVLIGFARRAADYYTRQAPWSLLRVNPERASTVVYVALCALRALAVLAYPLLPIFSKSVLQALGVEGEVGFKTLAQPLQVGNAVAEPKPVYSKITEKQVEELVAALHVEEKPEVDIHEFAKLDLKVATVVAAQRVPNTKRLLKLRVRVGEKLRTIVSGIGEQYTPEELVGKKIVVLMNLKPSVFAGVASRGMLLAAEGGGVISLLTPMRDVEDGSKVH